MRAFAVRPVRGAEVERPRPGGMALGRPEREIGRWHRDLDARYGGEPNLLPVAVEPGDRVGSPLARLVA